MASSAKVTVRLVPQASLNSGVPNIGVAGHSIVASVGQLATVGAAPSTTVMVWLQVVELLCASVAVQVRLILLTSLPLSASVSSAWVTVRLLSQASLNCGVPKTAVAGHSIVASAGQLATVGAAPSTTVMVWLQVVELLCASVAVQVRLILLTSLPLSASVSSAWVTVRLLSQASLNCGVPKTAVAGHSIVASAGQLATVGAAPSTTVMVWLQVVELLCASVAVQVRLILLTSLPLSASVSSAWVTVRLLSQASLNCGVPKTAVAGHSIVASAGQLATVGAAPSTTVMVWLQVVELLCASVAVQVRLILLTSLPLSASVSSAWVTVRLLSQASLNCGVPKTAVAGHSIVASAGQLATVGAAPSTTVMVWLQVVELLCASVAVQVRLILLTSLPLTANVSSAWVTVKLLSQASLNCGVPKTAVAGHSIVASAGQLATVGAALSSTVMVWLQVTELLCASVAVQVRLILLT